MATKTYQPRLKTKYSSEIAKNLMTSFNYTTVMQVPKLEKICINQGVGDAVSDKKMIESAVKEMTTITGQKAVPTYSSKDISNFKLRANTQVGVRVTLR